jgi:Type III secretion system lipoprotein chaperone (YscW)
LVKGRVVIAASVSRFVGGVIHVRLEDISYADKPATVVAESVIRGIAHDPANSESRSGTVVPFSLDPTTDIVADHDYAVRSWLSPGGDEQAGAGTVWSDESYRVLTRGFGSDITVKLGK